MITTPTPPADAATAVAPADPVTLVAPVAPVLGHGLEAPLVTGGSVAYANLDIAASAPVLSAVHDEVEAFLPWYASVHRGAGYASKVATDAYERSRATIGAFVGARPDDVVVLTAQTTDALNLLARAVPGRAVHLDLEHHANLLPWRRPGDTAVPARSTLAETLAALERELRREPAALLAVTGASNVTGEILPIARLSDLAHRHGARIAVDAAQLAPHRRVDLASTDVDYLALSGHKLYAPYGAGALVGRRDWLDAAPPKLSGGGAVRRVWADDVDWGVAPARHEAGSPNVVGALALAAACRAIEALGAGVVTSHEEALTAALRTGLAAVPGVRLLDLWPGEVDRIGVVSFTVDGVPAELVAQVLSAEHGIGVRDGRFCAHLLLDRLSPGRTAVRASVGLGTAGSEVDRLVRGAAALVQHGPQWRYAGADEGYVPLEDPRVLTPWVQLRAPGPPSC
ncbi:aminotransferase class V-fold PLP-dependent enzyme [Nocardioides zeae]|uniref:Selenocysteine lyase/cysteine desulfurase n=1 Tax=Nocardioides zeae TaxID=1457234 RepID=A0AAJ1TZL7_9ACTN|nr:aminotransferase class V-fold PLP-dependent enzyme [Nocardioides zeae]MDQ1103005.1 selenocysteine lyase/cysteine desulfurase [Nocardioides zeae]